MTLNTYTATEIGQCAIAGIKYALAIGGHVARYTAADFLPGHGGKAYLRIPGALTARSRDLRDETTAVVFDKIAENRISVDLTKHLVSGVALGDAELTLDLKDFVKQVLLPQTDAIADGIEKVLADVLDGVTATDASDGYNEAAPAALFTKGRRALRDRGVDVANEKLVAFVGGNIVDALLDSGALDFSKTGDADALRQGTLGRIHGFTAVETSRGIGADEVVFTTASGIYLATAAPVVPEGANFGETVTKDGLTVRYLRDYDASTLRDRSVVSTFVGAGITPLYEVQRDYDTGEATVSDVEGGAVVKLTTAAPEDIEDDDNIEEG